MSRLSRLVLALLMPVMLTGCPVVLAVAGAAAGAGAVMWFTGSVSEDISQPLYRVHRAAAAAALDLKMQVVRNELEEESGVVDADKMDGTRVVIKTSKLGEKSTRVRVRVGLTGDRAEARRVIEQLKKHL